MRRGTRRAVAERRLERENVHPPPNCMSGMGVAATVRVEVHVGSLSPSGHASGHPLPGQWPIFFITWEKPVPRLAAAMGHTVEVHHRSYRTTEWRSVRKAFAEAS